MDDPILTKGVQPLVDRFSIDHAKVARRAADGFLVAAVTLSLIKVWEQGATVMLDQSLHVLGAIILTPWMHWCARNGAITRTGALGVVHLGMRLMLLGFTVIDVLDLVRVGSDLADYADGALLRTVLQLAEDALGASALYLSACRAPPPRRRSGKPASSKAAFSC